MLRHGEMAAFVGPTGAGKSSLVNLIARFFEPEVGRILVDGLDISRHTLASLHPQLGIVLQDNFLFTGTVMENLRYGRPEASDEEVLALSKAIGAHEAIARLAQGYGIHEELLERGGKYAAMFREFVRG